MGWQEPVPNAGILSFAFQIFNDWGLLPHVGGIFNERVMFGFCWVHVLLHERFELFFMLKCLFVVVKIHFQTPLRVGSLNRIIPQEGRSMYREWTQIRDRLWCGFVQ